MVSARVMNDHFIYNSNRLSHSLSPRKLRFLTNIPLHHRLLYGRSRKRFTGQILDQETGLYYYGARYLDPRTSRWLSGDPAIGEYVHLVQVQGWRAHSELHQDLALE